MSLRTIIWLCVIAVLGTIPLSAQSMSSHRQTRAVAAPPELSGPPKIATVLTPVELAVAKSPVMEQMYSKDPTVLATALRGLTSFIQQDATNPDFFVMRANVSCEIPGSSKEGILRDIEMSIKLWKPSGGSAFDSLAGHLGQKAKVEFLLGRYVDALNDLDAGMRIDYGRADQMLNNGNVKPDEPISSPCMWSEADVNKLAELFPKDYRTALYVGLYRLTFSHYSLDTDYQPILKAFEHASELNPSSAIPSYFNAYPYVYGGIGGLMSEANAKCLDDVVPRTKECLRLDEIHRIGVRYLTKAIAADPTFEPAYALRAGAHLKLGEARQAVRDYTQALQLDPKDNLYQDRASAESELREYQAAILDYTKGIARGCDSDLCGAYENRANVYLKLHDYPHAIGDLSHAIRNFLAGTIYGFNIDQFRRIYPEYDDVADDVLCEKLRILFNPQISYADYSKQFLINAKEFDDFVLPGLYLKRGDAYSDMGDAASANREYNRVSAGFPKWAESEFTMRNGKRIRVRR
jgi:tetratricopeptide (TPR) repeat protein